MSRALDRIGHEIIVLAPDDPAVVPGWQTNVKVKRIRYVWPDTLSVLGHARSLAGDVHLKWRAYPLAVLFSVFATMNLCKETIQQESEVIYAQWLLPSGFIGAIASRLTGIPLVVSLHGSDVFVAERNAIFSPATNFVFRTASHVIACSKNLASRAIALGLPHQSVTVVPYGVNVERFVPNQESGEKLRSLLDIPKSKQVVMVMGRLVYKKGFPYFLQAIPLVLSSHPDTHFIIAGDGDLRSHLEEMAGLLHVQKHVSFTGHIPWDRTSSYLAMADIFVVPSILDDAGNLDGLPNVLLESMASGCAIIATDVAGIPEVVQDGKNGVLVPEKDEQALSNAICYLLSNPQIGYRLGVAARETVVSDLNWARIGDRIAAILRAHRITQ
jgi:glycosyltransferase involved in cell wall biosynthesis